MWQETAQEQGTLKAWGFSKDGALGESVCKRTQSKGQMLFTTKKQVTREGHTVAAEQRQRSSVDCGNPKE